MHKHIKEKMKIWDIEQEATVMGEALEEATVMVEGMVEVMGMGQDTHIRVTRPDAQGSLGYKDGGGITPIMVQPYQVYHRYPLLTRRNSS